MSSLKDVVRKPALHNAIPGYGIAGSIVSSTPPANTTGVWVEMCKPNTKWEEVQLGYFNVLYCEDSDAERSISLSVFKRGR